MKKIICMAIIAIITVTFGASIAQAERAIQPYKYSVPVATAPAPASEERGGYQSSLFTASGITSAVKNAVNNGLASVNQKIADLKSAIEKKDTKTAKAIAKKDAATAKSINVISDKIDQQGRDFKTFSERLTGKEGEFAKTNAKINEIDSSFLWFFLALAILIIGAFFLIKKPLNFIKKVLNQIEKKIDTAPEKTAKAVHDYFDPKPLEVVAGRHKVVFTQKEDVLDRKAYQVLMVEEADVDAAMKPEDYELHEFSRRDKAEDSLKRTMREFFSGKLASKSDPASLLTIKLIGSYRNNGRLVITKL